MVLALVAERIAQTPFHDLVRDRVWRPAGMTSTTFHRMDQLPGTAAIGYLPDGRSNVLHLPVRGNGDGGAFSTVADFRSFWAALFAGRIVGPDRVAQLVAPHSTTPDEGLRYGLGFWLAARGPMVLLVGGDAGVSFVSEHDPASGRTSTVVTNASIGAAAIWRRLGELEPG